MYRVSHKTWQLIERRPKDSLWHNYVNIFSQINSLDNSHIIPPVLIFKTMLSSFFEHVKTTEIWRFVEILIISKITDDFQGVSQLGWVFNGYPVVSQLGWVFNGFPVVWSERKTIQSWEELLLVSSFSPSLYLPTHQRY